MGGGAGAPHTPRTWYMAWVRTSTCDGRTVMCGWEWYHPITRVGRPVTRASSSASCVDDISISTGISTWPGAKLIRSICVAR